MKNRLSDEFFRRDVLEVAPALLGKDLVRCFESGETKRYRITETEAYNGKEDLACHASKGRTKRTEIMFQEGGLIYVYLIYGMYWLLNFVTGEEGNPSAVLIRGLTENYSSTRANEINGPGRVGKELKLDKSFYGEDLKISDRIWIEESGTQPAYTSTPRIGIEYSGEPWASMPWRFILTVSS